MTARAAPLQSDVLVLGGGVIGLACAYALLKQGRSVTVLEQNTAGSGASHGNCGTLTPSLLPLPAPGVIRQALRWMVSADSPLLIRPSLNPQRLRWLLDFAARCNARDFEQALRVKLPLLIAARALLEQWLRDENLDCEFSASGHLNVYRDAQRFDLAQKNIPLTRSLGLVTEVLDGNQARALEPALNTSIIGALHNPGDAKLRPARYAAELARVVRARGGLIAEQTAVTGFKVERGRVQAVITTQGEYRARDLVFALGAWSPLLARQLGLRLPIQPGKGYSITYPPQHSAPRIPLVLKERSVCVTAWGSGYRLGSTMEFAGYDSRLNRRRLDALPRGAAEYLNPVLEAPVIEKWAGWRPMTPDDLPILGRAPALDNLWLATGHGMVGVTLSAITGQLIAEMLCGQTPSMDTDPLSPCRFR